MRFAHGAVERHIGYFRVFGYGLHWKDARAKSLLWSEREGMYVQFRVGPWLITPLKRGARGWYRR